MVVKFKPFLSSTSDNKGVPKILSACLIFSSLESSVTWESGLLVQITIFLEELEVNVSMPRWMTTVIPGQR